MILGLETPTEFGLTVDELVDYYQGQPIPPEGEVIFSAGLIERARASGLIKRLRNTGFIRRIRNSGPVTHIRNSGDIERVRHSA